MGTPASELYANCPHCGERIGSQTLVFRLDPAAHAQGGSSRPSPDVGPVAAAPVPADRPNPPAATPTSTIRPPNAAPRTMAPRPKTAAPPHRPGWRNYLPVRIWKKYFPPVRLVWIFLAIIVWNVDGFVSRTAAEPLLALPVVAALADLGLQATRFPRLRFPDAAIANGLFLSLILWPTTISLELTAIAVVTVGARHFIRVGGHPVFNPAALGVTLAAVLFALPQPWHVGLTLDDTILIAVLGLILWSRAWHTWRLWAVFFFVNIAATLVLADYLAGSSVLPLVIQTSVLGSAPVFFGFFMVTEPRTAPSARWAMIAFAGLVGLSAALLPILFGKNADLNALGVLTPYLALFFGNIFAVVIHSARGAQHSVKATAPVPRTAPARRPSTDS